MARRDSTRGFTLTEVVVSTLILGGVLLAVYSAISTARRISAYHEARTACLHFARGVMEELLSYSYEDSALSAGSGKQIKDKNGVYRGYYTISNSNTGDARSPYKDITLVIEWLDPVSKKKQEVRIMTSHSKSLHR